MEVAMLTLEFAADNNCLTGHPANKLPAAGLKLNAAQRGKGRGALMAERLWSNA